MSPRLAKAHYFLGTALKTLGRYDEALEHLTIAAEQYPRDRVVLNQIGRVHFLQRQFDEAIAAFKQCAGRRSGRSRGALQSDARPTREPATRELAERERALYTRFKADETAQAITGPYRLKSPDDNNERQADPRTRHGVRTANSYGIRECESRFSDHCCWR